MWTDPLPSIKIRLIIVVTFFDILILWTSYEHFKIYKTFKIFNADTLFEKLKYKKNYEVEIFTRDNILTCKFDIGQYPL